MVLVVGTFFWYPNDSSETYFRRYDMHAGNRFPWWQIELSAGDVLELPVSLPRQAPDGRWFFEVFGHPVDSATGGTLDIDGATLPVTPSRGPHWHRVELDERPEPGKKWLSLRYRPESRDETNARFRIWGKSVAKGRMPRVNSSGGRGAAVGEILIPLSLRWQSVEPGDLNRWKRIHTSKPIPVPFFRVGVRTSALGSKRIGNALIGVSTVLLSLLLLGRFALYALRQPGFGLAVALISIAAIWLRLDHLSSLSDLAEVEGNGFMVRDWLVFDSANYFVNSVQILSSELRSRHLDWPIGMPTFSAFFFRWGSVDPHVAKVGFAVLQALVGPLLFFCCLPVLRNKALAFLPLVTWTVFFRPMKYSYFFLAESLTMCMLISWMAILFSRDPRVRDRHWPWIVLSSSILFTLSTYARDVVIAFLPAFLAMIAVFVGSHWRQRAISVGCALAIVVALWSVTPVLIDTKKFSLNPSEFLPVTRGHNRSPNRFGRQDPNAAKRPRSSPSESGIGPAIHNVFEQASSRPGVYLVDGYAAAKRFWDPEQRWYQRSMNDDPAYRESFFTRLVEHELKQGTGYAAIVFVLLSTAVFGLFFSAQWMALAGFLFYVTLFHVLLFPGFTSRPKAIFFPFIVLFASSGVFAFVEGFVPWLGQKIAASRWRGA